MPNVFGKESKKKELVNNLGEIYAKIEREHQISAGDFPSLRKMQVQPSQLVAPVVLQGARLPKVEAAAPHPNWRH